MFPLVTSHYEELLVQHSFARTNPSSAAARAVAGSPQAPPTYGRAFLIYGHIRRRIRPRLIFPGLRHRFPILDKPVLCGSTGCCGESALSPNVWRGYCNVRFLIMFVVLLFEIVLLMVDFSHYTVDIVIGVLVGVLVLSSDRVQYILYYWNWKVGVVPMEDNL